jgi:hypothetical protein
MSIVSASFGRWSGGWRLASLAGLGPATDVAIFISYRRQDAATEAARIYDRLIKPFGRDGVFKDLDSTSPGDKWAHVIRQTIAMCDVLLVVIGPHWLQKYDGASRLHDPQDWVRTEILSALQRKILVIPILVDDATMPAEADLPEELQPLTTYQAQVLTEAGWRSELTRLVKKIRTHQRALDDPGNVHARSRYYPFVGRRALQPGSSSGSDIPMEDQTGARAKDLGATIEMSVADELVAQLSRAARRWCAIERTSAISAPVIRNRRSAAIASTRRSQVRFATVAAAEERSARLPRPSRR